jgi:aminopeptidase N
MIQAMIPGENTLARVQKLTSHSAFSLSNPNRTRSLIGAFASGNQTGFNRVDGKAYEFFADIVLELDRLNPQVTARLLTAMRSWQALEPVRRQKAKTALKRIAAEKLSNDTRDIVDRILN